jgi:hypothetical protein
MPCAGGGFGPMRLHLSLPKATRLGFALDAFRTPTRGMTPRQSLGQYKRLGTACVGR